MKRVICILGIPGAGKSTVIRSLAPILNAQVAHPGQWAREQVAARGLPADTHRRANKIAEMDLIASKGELLPIDSNEFLDSAINLPGNNIILDGFPRSPEQAKVLRERFPSAMAIVLEVPRDEALRRQEKREGEDRFRQEAKIKRFFASDLPAIKMLPHHIVSAMGSKADTLQAVLRILWVRYVEPIPSTQRGG